MRMQVNRASAGKCSSKSMIAIKCDSLASGIFTGGDEREVLTGNGRPSKQVASLAKKVIALSEAFALCSLTLHVPCRELQLDRVVSWLAHLPLIPMLKSARAH